MSVLLIDPFSSGAHYHELLREAGIDYHAVRTLRALHSGLSHGEAVPCLVIDDSSEEQLDEIVRYCRDHEVEAIITGAESGVPLAEAVKVELGFASAAFADHGRRFWDKALLYDTLRRAAVRVPERIAVCTPDDVASGAHEAVLADVSFPVVVKPDVGAGSVGVRIVDAVQEGLEAIESIVHTPGFFGGELPNAVVQEFVSGREYVIDTVSHAGEHRIVAVCTYDKHPSSNGAMVYDRLRWIEWESSETSMLADYACDVLRGLDHREGAVHMEVILDDRGPCLIDLGARPHGAGHPLKTYALTGSSQLHAEVAIAAGVEVLPQTAYQLGAHAAIEFLSLDRPAVIRADAEPISILQMEFVLSGDVPAQPGVRYPETHSLLESEELGLVFISGEDDAMIVENARRLRSAFHAMLETADHAR